jgi:membrane protein
MIIGAVVVRRAPPRAPAERALIKFLRGFQITFALATAFLFVLVAAPIRKLIAMARGLMDDYIPLIVEPKAQPETAAIIESVLTRHGYAVRREEPGWSMKAPGAILGTLGGGSFSHFVPQQIEFFKAPNLEVVINPGGVTLRGRENATSKAHGLIAEAMTRTSALQSLDPLAQVVERQIKDVWKVFAENPAAHAGSAVLKARLAEISREIANLRVPYEQWQIVYRQALQLARALDGRGELLDESIFKEETMMTTTPKEPQAENGRGPAPDDVPRDVPLTELLSHITDSVKLLASKEAELAKAELQSNLTTSVGTAKSLGIAAVCALLGLNMLMVAAVLGLATVIEPWMSALIVATALLAIGAAVGAIGWSHRLKNPLEATRASLKEDVQWMNNRLA